MLYYKILFPPRKMFSLHLTQTFQLLGYELCYSVTFSLNQKLIHSLNLIIFSYNLNYTLANYREADTLQEN
jgi:hypothetical protein